MPTELEMVLRVLLAAALGAAVGYQRAAAHKPAGIRTHSLIAIGAALFTLAAPLAFPDADPTRVSSGIVTGIGFLGAGAIIRREGGLVGGLTTAASIWVVAALGMAAGMGLYVIAAAVGAIVIVILLVPTRRGQTKLEDRQTNINRKGSNQNDTGREDTGGPLRP
jgi:putative Mg2+ transporter-C (MgtC) family protein